MKTPAAGSFVAPALIGVKGIGDLAHEVFERLETGFAVALRVEDTDDPDRFRVSGRGELHLSVLIETMRREGYELAISRPEVILHETDHGREEPYETLVVDLESDYQGAVMERLGERRGELKNMQLDGKGRVRLDYLIPARGLIGFQSEFRTLTAGTGTQLSTSGSRLYAKHNSGGTQAGVTGQAAWFDVRVKVYKAADHEPRVTFPQFRPQRRVPGQDGRRGRWQAYFAGVFRRKAGIE